MILCYNNGFSDLMKSSIYIINIHKIPLASYCTFSMGIHLKLGLFTSTFHYSLLCFPQSGSLDPLVSLMASFPQLQRLEMEAEWCGVLSADLKSQDCLGSNPSSATYCV